MEQSIEELIKNNIEKYTTHNFEEARIISLTGLIKDSKFVYGKNNEHIINIHEFIKFSHTYGFIPRLLPKFVKVGKYYKAYKFLTIVKISKKDDYEDCARLSWGEYSDFKSLIRIAENERNRELVNKIKTE